MSEDGTTAQWKNKNQNWKWLVSAVTFLKKSSWTLRLTRMMAVCPLRICLTSQTTSVHHDLLQFYTNERSCALTCTLVHTQCSVAAAAAEVSPVRHSASCPRGEGSARLSVGPSAVPDHCARCSWRLWPVGRLKCVRYDLKEGQELSRGSATHIVRKDIGDSHKDGVFGSHGGQMQPELQITHRVTAEVLQLQTQTT